MFSILLIFAQAAPLPECDQQAADQGIQSAMNLCAARDFAEADGELNAQWKLTRAKMKQYDAQWHDDDGPGYFETLLEAQRAWLNYRDAHCRSEGYLARGGSIEALFVSDCMTTLTKARTKQLRDLANFPD